MTKIFVRTYPEEAYQKLSQAGIHPVLARLFAARGIADPSELSTELKDILPPAMLHNIEQAADLLADAIRDKKKITVVADYDCDGATACAVALLGLKEMGADIDFIMPNRFENGYGLTPALADLAKTEHGTEVLLTVDNGITSIAGVARANELGMHVLVTDHHLPDAELPKDCVIVNPNQPDCHFPSKHIAGVGVIFYVLLELRAECRRRGIFTKETQPNMTRLLDLVALGTYADVVKLDTNNRILVAQGLRRIRSGSTRPGILALFNIAGRNAKKATADDLGFQIAPRLNAAGRLGDMAQSVNLLLGDDNYTTWKIAREIDQKNAERKTLTEAADQAIQDMLPRENAKLGKSICLSLKNGHIGTIGLSASNLKDKFFRPTIVFTESKDGLTGSGRSIPAFHLRDAIAAIAKQHPGLVLRLGGHKTAAGLTIQKDGFHVFAKAFEAIAKTKLTASQMERVIETDGSLDTHYLNTDFASLLENQIWGEGFPAPLFCDKFTIVDRRVLKQKHLRLQVERDGTVYNAIWFNFENSLGGAKLSSEVRLLYRPSRNEYHGRVSLQLQVEHADTQRRLPRARPKMETPDRQIADQTGFEQEGFQDITLDDIYAALDALFKRN